MTLRQLFFYLDQLPELLATESLHDIAVSTYPHLTKESQGQLMQQWSKLVGVQEEDDKTSNRIPADRVRAFIGAPPLPET